MLTLVLLPMHKIQGSAVPTGSDSSHWQDVILRFGPHSERLRDAVAGLTRFLVNSLVDRSHICALLTSRLIALDKSPGIRPISVAETLRRIFGKVVCLLTREDTETVCEVSQLCAGLKCGIEGAIHAASGSFISNVCGMLISDPGNAFNSINKISLLWNVCVL